MTTRIELIYDPDCPNIEAARTVLRAACRQAGTDAVWQEWSRADPSSPDYVAKFGSPTILVDGKDVAGADSGGDAKSCRVYDTAEGGLTGVPEATQVARHLQDADPQAARTLGALAPLLATAGALLPALSCPLCWPAYAGLLSALGLGFFDYTPWLAPLSAVLVLTTLVALGLGVRRHGDRRPLVVGLVGAAALLIGYLDPGSQWLTRIAAAALVVAGLWNFRAPRTSSCESCTTSVPAEDLSADPAMVR